MCRFRIRKLKFFSDDWHLWEGRCQFRLIILSYGILTLYCFVGILWIMRNRLGLFKLHFLLICHPKRWQCRRLTDKMDTNLRHANCGSCASDIILYFLFAVQKVQGINRSTLNLKYILSCYILILWVRTSIARWITVDHLTGLTLPPFCPDQG